MPTEGPSQTAVTGRGFRSWLSLIGVVVVLAVVAAIVIPGRLCCGPRGPEASTIGLLRSINSSQQAFSSSCTRSGDYARTLQELTVAPNGGPPFLSQEAISPNTNGYVISMIPIGLDVTGEGCNGAGLAKGYFVEAYPQHGTAHLRYFATDHRGTIYTSDRRIPQDMSGARPLQ